MDGASPEQIERFRRDLIALTAEAPAAERRLGVAVSGGPDSLALLLLAHAAFPDAVSVATVDHGLRPEAADEARHVAAICAMLGLPHSTLRQPDHFRIDGARRGSQGWARGLRYALLEFWSAGAGIGWIATAHHADDQAETLLMRLARGSGLAGLSAIRPIAAARSQPPAPPTIRPLLGWRRVELGAIVTNAGIVAVDDPSNRNPAYDRTAFRALVGATPLLDVRHLAAASAHLGEAEDAIEWIVARLWEERARVENYEVVVIDPAGLPRELRRRLLKRALEHLHFEFDVRTPLRLDGLNRLLILLDSGCAGTLSCFLARPGPPWRIEPAPPRRDS